MTKFQQKETWCGPAALQNALRCIGRQVGQSRLADLAGTDLDGEGTCEEGLIRAALATGLAVDVFSADCDRAASQWLRGHVRERGPAILSVDHYGHWICAAGTCGSRVIVIEPSVEAFSRAENGVLPMGMKRLLGRWRAARRWREKDAAFYGLGVS